MNTERRRLPNERNGFTKKLSITHPHPIGSSTNEVLFALKKLATAVDGGKEDEIRAARLAAQIVLDKFSQEQIVTTKLYISTGHYDDGSVGEIFLKADRMGSTISGLLDAISMCLSIGLQSGVPISWFADKLCSMRFEPSGATNDPEMPRVTSLMDGLARWLKRRYTINSQTDEHET